jgi:RloB-like protein
MSPRAPKPSGRLERCKDFSPHTDLLRRTDGSRTERPSFLILCEGKTEKGYFTGMRTRRGPQIDVDDHGDHVALVQEAVRRRRESEEYTAVWCVLDTELDFALTARIVEAAEGSDIELALSTPCFEVWLILHHDDHTAPFQSAEKAKKKLKDGKRPRPSMQISRVG